MADKIDRWGCRLSVQTSRDHEAILSWFPFAPEGCAVVHAEVYEADDGSTPKIRALVRRKDGKLRQLEVRQNRSGTKHVAGPPTATFLKRAQRAGHLQEPSDD